MKDFLLSDQSILLFSTNRFSPSPDELALKKGPYHRRRSLTDVLPSLLQDQLSILGYCLIANSCTNSEHCLCFYDIEGRNFRAFYGDLGRKWNDEPVYFLKVESDVSWLRKVSRHLKNRKNQDIFYSQLKDIIRESYTIVPFDLYS